MTVTINGTSGITTPGVNSTGSNVLGDNVADTLNVGNGAIVTDASGNVGIGTINPGATLNVGASGGGTVSGYQGIVVGGSNGGELQLRNTAGTVQFAQYADANGVSYINYGATYQAWSNGGAEKMRIDSSGNLLVGATSQVLSAPSKIGLPFNGADQFGIAIKTTTNSGYGLYFGNASGTGIGSVSMDASSVYYNTSSDYRLKENIQPMQNALATVAQLNPVTYNWKADGSDGQGFIAHELQAVVPDCVTGEKDAVREVDVLDEDGKKIGVKEEPVYQGIDTSFLVATLCKAIQELKAEVDGLKAQLEAK